MDSDQEIENPVANDEETEFLRKLMEFELFLDQRKAEEKAQAIENLVNGLDEFYRARIASNIVRSHSRSTDLICLIAQNIDTQNEITEEIYRAIESMDSASEFNYSISDESLKVSRKKQRKSNIVKKTIQKKKPIKKKKKSQTSQTLNTKETEAEMDCSQPNQSQEETDILETEIHDKPTIPRIADRIEEKASTSKKQVIEIPSRKRKPSPEKIENKPKDQEDDKENKPAKQKPPPPITVTNETTYRAIITQAKENGYEVINASMTDNLIRIYPKAPDDYRKIIKLLEAKDQEFFCRPMDPKNIIKAVMKSIPKFIQVQEIQEELEAQGFVINKIDRMSKKTITGDKIAIPMVLVQLPRNEQSKKIFRLTEILNFKTIVEPKKNIQNHTSMPQMPALRPHPTHM